MVDQRKRKKDLQGQKEKKDVGQKKRKLDTQGNNTICTSDKFKMVYDKESVGKKEGVHVDRLYNCRY